MKIDGLLAKVEDHIKGKESSVISFLENLVHGVFQYTVNNNDNYCMRFKVPTDAVTINLVKMIGLTQDEIVADFKSDWGLTGSNYVMYGNVYYHILLLLCYYGAIHNNERIYLNSLKLILFKMWNGRLQNAIKFCDAKTMAYVVNNMTNNRNLIKKYNSPFRLITEYFTKTIAEKYIPMIKNDSSKIKLLFNQCYGRLEQIFYQSYGINLLTNKNVAKSGLAPAYYEAKKKGLQIGTVDNHNDEENQLSLSDKLIGNHNDEIINDIVNTITMDSTFKYDLNFIRTISASEKINSQGIESIIKAMHNVKYEPFIYDSLVFLLSIINPRLKSDICDGNFFDNVVKRKIISSKHSPVINNLKTTLDQFLVSIMNDLGYNYKQYSNVRQVQFRNILIYLLSYNVKKYICHSII